MWTIGFPSQTSGYDSARYELLARCLEKGVITSLRTIIGLYDVPGEKVELNNRQNSIVSLGMPGRHAAWPEADYETRREIYRDHKRYTQGLIWFLQNDPRVRDPIQNKAQLLGLCKDDWPDNNHWPYYLDPV